MTRRNYSDHYDPPGDDDRPTWGEAQEDAWSDALARGDHAEAARLAEQGRRRLARMRGER